MRLLSQWPVIGDRLSLRTASDVGPSDGSTEDDPVGPVTPRASSPTIHITAGPNAS